MGFNCFKVTATSRRQFTFYHSVSRNSWYSFYRPWKDERLSRPWSHPVVLNTGPLDWESSAITTRPLMSQNILQNLFIRKRGKYAVRKSWKDTNIFSRKDTCIQSKNISKGKELSRSSVLP